MQLNLFKNKYKTHSPRMYSKDYSEDGKYCITICTKDRKEYFGKVIDKTMKLNQIGEIVDKYWQEITNHFKDVRIVEYVVMPNHIHGIIEINHNYQEYLRTGFVPKIDYSRFPRRDEAVPRLYRTDKNFYKTISPKPNSIPVIIGSFKSICTKKINQHFPNLNFSWQNNYHDIIIKNEQTLENMIYYIRNNPLLWNRDRNNLKNIKK